MPSFVCAMDELCKLSVVDGSCAESVAEGDMVCGGGGGGGIEGEAGTHDCISCGEASAEFKQNIHSNWDECK